MRGIRSRLALTLVALVALTVTAIGVGTYAFVDARLRAGLLDEAQQQAQFDLSVLLPGRLPQGAKRADFEASGLPAAFALRGQADLIVDFGDDDPYVAPASLLATFRGLPPALRDSVAAGRLAYAWRQVDGHGALIVGGRQSGGPAVYLVVDASPVDAAMGQLRLGLLAAGLIAILIALATAGLVARRILRPIASGSAAAGRIAAGDLEARIPVEGNDELARWAIEFNAMADSLRSTIRSLEDAQQQNRRFVADVSHELRTPLTALVAEASIIEGKLGDIDPDGRRAAELLVADVRRLRVLIDDLMELSRFDAAAEAVVAEPADLGRVLGSIIQARLPAATLRVPPERVVVESDIRRLDRILGNLLDNARIHAPGATVEVTLSAEPGEVRIVVADRGPGLAAADLAHVFDRFYKADPARAATTTATSGLGLAIAAEHTALLGGSLSGGRQGRWRADVHPDPSCDRFVTWRRWSRYEVTAGFGDVGAHLEVHSMNRHLGFISRSMTIVAVLAVVAACGPGTGDLGSVATPAPTSAASVDVPSAEPTGGAPATTGPGDSGSPSQSTTPADTTTVRAYFFLGSFTEPSGLVPVLREIPRTQAVATAAMNALIAGPIQREMETSPAMYTTIPDGTQLLGLTIADGVATVNLSKEFESGGGSASVLGRLAQVVYTLTQFPTVKTVLFELDGQAVTTFSGEGVVLDHPVGRSDYTDQLPAIWVDRPAWGAAIGNPARVAGLANVFEATFRIAIVVGAHPPQHFPSTLLDIQVKATCGTGCWGSFDTTFEYAVETAQWGRLRVYDLSAKDGTFENVTEYPVWLTPKT